MRKKGTLLPFENEHIQCEKLFLIDLPSCLQCFYVLLLRTSEDMRVKKINEQRIRYHSMVGAGQTRICAQKVTLCTFIVAG